MTRPIRELIELGQHVKPNVPISPSFVRNIRVLHTGISYYYMNYRCGRLLFEAERSFFVPYCFCIQDRYTFGEKREQDEIEEITTLERQQLEKIM